MKQEEQGLVKHEELVFVKQVLVSRRRAEVGEAGGEGVGDAEEEWICEARDEGYW